MPKLKTHRGAAKRIRCTGTGKFKRGKAYKSHILTKKSTKKSARKQATRNPTARTSTRKTTAGKVTRKAAPKEAAGRTATRKSAPKKMAKKPMTSRSTKKKTSGRSAARKTVAAAAPSAPPVITSHVRRYKEAKDAYARSVALLQEEDWPAASRALIDFLSEYSRESELAERARMYLRVCGQHLDKIGRAECRGRG